YLDVNPPSPEISHEEIFQAKVDLMKSIQTFLESFNCIPFEEKPQILFQTLETFFAIQCSQPEDSNELFQKLLKDLKELAEESPENYHEENVVSKTNQEPPQDTDIHQLIDECYEEVHEEQKQNIEKMMFDLVKICHHKQFLFMHDNVYDLIESALDSKLLSINSINSQRLDKKEQVVKIVEEQPAERRNLAPILSTKEHEHLLSMGYEHLSINPETESDEVTESNAKNLLPIPSECEVTLEDKMECDELVCDNYSDTFSDSKIDDDISVYDDDFENIEYVEASLPDPKIVSIEEENGVEEENVVQREEDGVDLEDIS
nr:hypothetical protein [Tanacetum cinerariifolium]